MVKQFEIRRPPREEEEIAQAIVDVFDSGRYVKGPECEAFEVELAEYLGAKHCIAVSSGTAALEVSLAACGRPRDIDTIVAVPGFTFPATAEPVISLGMNLALVDCDLRTRLGVFPPFNGVQPDNLVLIPVHLYGLRADVDLLCRSFPFATIIEDACQSIGATDPVFGNRPVGLCACYSFFPSKNLGAIGDGGAIITDNEQFARTCRMLRDHGRRSTDDFFFVGSNKRMSELIAAGLRVSLRFLDSKLSTRAETAYYYMEHLQELDRVGLIHLPYVPDGFGHSWHQFVILLPEGDRDSFRKFLLRNDVDTRVHYPYWLGELEAFKYEFPESLKNCVELSRRSVSLPMYAYMDESERETVVLSISKYFKTRSV